MKKLFVKILCLIGICCFILSICEIEHIFCELNTHSENFKIALHEHSKCSHHCADTDEVHSRHSKPHNCCDSEEPHDHPTQNPLTISNLEMVSLPICLDSFSNFTVINSNINKSFHSSLISENIQLLSIKTVVLTI